MIAWGLIRRRKAVSLSKIPLAPFDNGLRGDLGYSFESEML
jgi:hypothetical protein